MNGINLSDKFALFHEFWSPRIVGELNDSYVKLVKLKGEFFWHRHENEDESFLVVKGRLLHWDAQLFQDIPNQALGWKSVSGPKHSGRISFAPLGDDTQVHVVMNYSPPVWRFARALAPLQDEIGDHIE